MRKIQKKISRTLKYVLPANNNSVSTIISPKPCLLVRPTMLNSAQNGECTHLSRLVFVLSYIFRQVTLLTGTVLQDN